jgi:hypothetical protein
LLRCGVEVVEGSRVEDQPKHSTDTGAPQRRDVTFDEAHIHASLLDPLTSAFQSFLNDVYSRDLPAALR